LPPHTAKKVGKSWAALCLCFNPIDELRTVPGKQALDGSSGHQRFLLLREVMPHDVKHGLPRSLRVRLWENNRSGHRELFATEPLGNKLINSRRNIVEIDFFVAHD